MNQLEGFAGSFVQKAIIYVTYVSAYILIAGDVLYAAFKNIKSGRLFDEKFLMTMATITALLIQYYDEAVLVMLFYKIGELLQLNAVNYSRKSIANLINIQPQSATVLVDGEFVQMDPVGVVEGDIIFVKPGERIPLDGVVIEGEGEIDNSALTGESLHAEVEPGSSVLSGGINVNGNLKIRVTKNYMIPCFESWTWSKMPAASKASRKITLQVRALLHADRRRHCHGFGHNPLHLRGFELADRVQRINQDRFDIPGRSCPCALVISIPLFLWGIGGASRRGYWSREAIFWKH